MTYHLDLIKYPDHLFCILWYRLQQEEKIQTILFNHVLFYFNNLKI